jgi:glycosyltransferase involved in cell wall biosynthesis
MSGLVSVVIIFRDAERFLDEAIASVFAQTYPNWELVLVDDGSRDGGPRLARSWASRYSRRVRCVSHPGDANRGMSASRNLGIRYAHGEYLAFLDADDVWLPPKLTRQVALLDGWCQVGMVYGPTQWWYSWTGRPEDRQRDFVHRPGVPADRLLEPPAVLTHFLLHETDSPCTCSILARRAAVERVGGFEETFRGLYEDQAFCAKLCLMFPVVASDDCLYRYRQHPDSACSVAARAGQVESARRQFLIWLEAYLATHQVRDPGLCAALRLELWRCRHPLARRILSRGGRAAVRMRGLLRRRASSPASLDASHSPPSG